MKSRVSCWAEVVPCEYQPLSTLCLRRATLTRHRFRWVELQLNSLFKCKSEESVRNSLKNLPKTLADAYRKIYEDEIMALDEYDRLRADRAIMWVMCAHRPLRVTELLDAIRINTEEAEPWLMSRVDEGVVLSLCNDLLVVDHSRSVWVWAHLSVLEFFETQKGQHDRTQNLVAAPPSRQHAEESVASACLVLLNHPPYKYESHTYIVGDTRCRDFDHRGDVTSYVLRHWGQHLTPMEQRLDVSVSKSTTARLLRMFLGSPQASSHQYRSWCNHRMHTRRMMEPPVRMMEPPVRMMAALGLYYLLHDWWQDDRTLVKPRNDADPRYDADPMHDYEPELLLLAAESRSVALCRHLISKGFRPDDARRYTGVPNLGRPGTLFFVSALWVAAYNGQLELVKLLVEEGGARVDLFVGRGSARYAARVSPRQCWDVLSYLERDGLGW